MDQIQAAVRQRLPAMAISIDYRASRFDRLGRTLFSANLMKDQKRCMQGSHWRKCSDSIGVKGGLAFPAAIASKRSGAM